MFRFYSTPSASFVRPFHLGHSLFDDEAVLPAGAHLAGHRAHVHRKPLSVLSLPFFTYGKRSRSAIDEWLDDDNDSEMSDDEVRVIDHKQTDSKSSALQAPASCSKEGRLFKKARTSSEVEASFAFGNELSIKENEKNWSVSLHAPAGGKLVPEKVNVQVKNGMITISGTTNTESKREGNDFSYVSQSSTSFSRSLPLPRDVDEENISAELGQDAQSLFVTMPKRAATQPKTIAVAVKAAPVQPQPQLETKEAPQPVTQSLTPTAASTSSLPSSSFLASTILSELPAPVVDRVSEFVGTAAAEPSTSA